MPGAPPQFPSFAKSPSDTASLTLACNVLDRLPVSPRKLLSVCCSILLATYVLIGAANIAPVLTLAALHPNAPFASTDFYLETLTGAPHLSKGIEAAIARIPEEKAVVLIVAESGVRSALIAQTVGYLSWPHEVRWLTANSTDAHAALFAMTPSSVGAVLFWEVKPFAEMPPGIPMGPQQVLVPLAAAVARNP